MLTRIARRNLLHNRRRFLASVAGVSFSVTLVIVQLGLFAGLAANASQVIDKSPGDVWVTGRNTGNFQWGQPIPRRTLDVVRSTAGVAWAHELIAAWTQLRHRDGGLQQLELVGFDPRSRVGAPWNVVAGRLDDLSVPGRVVLDRTATGKLGDFALGDDVEVANRRLRVAAVTEGITNFTTAPFAFTSLDTARSLTTYLRADDTVYVVAGLASRSQAEATQAALRRRLPHLDVSSRDAFSARTRRYWMFETGMGIGFLLTSGLAIAVGTVIVSQTIFAATSEHLAEYATLKAMGAANGSLARVVLVQGFVAGTVGCLPGCLLGAAVVYAIRARGLAAVVTPELVGLTIVAALATCALAALGSVRRLWKLEPALVFRT